MVMNKFNDSLDGSITKPSKQKTLLSKMSENLDRIIDNAPNIPESTNVLTNDEIILKALRKKGRVYASWLSDHIGIPERTTRSTLKRLKQMKLATSKYEMVLSEDGKHRKANMYYLIEDNTVVKKNERRKKK